MDLQENNSCKMKKLLTSRVHPCHVKTATLAPDWNEYTLFLTSSVPKISACPCVNYRKKQFIRNIFLQKKNEGDCNEYDIIYNTC